ncbi:MAG: TetR/AcrR family transcriptional regulator, partial [Bacteroidota bacterium]
MEQKLTYILAKSYELFNKYGIRSITMDDVCRELGISKKTLYDYIENKEDLVRKFVESDVKRREDNFLQIFNMKYNAIEELFEVHKLIKQMIKEYNPSTEFDLKKYYPEIFKDIKNGKRQKMFEAVLNNLIKGKQEGLYRHELDENIIAKLYVSRIESTCENDIFTEEEYKSPAFINDIIVYHIRGVANKKGIDV